ncbi:hypothetical protein ABFS83_05G104000 [Erythranthe nasuta]
MTNNFKYENSYFFSFSAKPNQTQLNNLILFSSTPSAVISQPKNKQLTRNNKGIFRVNGYCCKLTFEEKQAQSVNLRELKCLNPEYSLQIHDVDDEVSDNADDVDEHLDHEKIMRAPDYDINLDHLHLRFRNIDVDYSTTLMPTAMSTIAMPTPMRMFVMKIKVVMLEMIHRPIDPLFWIEVYR